MNKMYFEKSDRFRGKDMFLLQFPKICSWKDTHKLWENYTKLFYIKI